jgi:hypothetical protein
MMSGLSQNVTGPWGHVTYRDTHDKFAGQATAIVGRMKNATRYLTNIMLPALPLAALIYFTTVAANDSENVLLRYQAEVASNLSMSLKQDIRAGEKENPVASREFSMGYTMKAQAEPGKMDIELNAPKASYTAHDMKQRLGTKHLTGKGFALAINEAGRGLSRAHAGEEQNMSIGLGPYTDPGYASDGALVDILPMLPAEPVSAGSSWETQRDTRTLVGWSWAQGQMQSHHEVTAIEQKENHTIVSVASNSTMKLSALEGSEQYSGDGNLMRSYQWRFDATNGHLLSLSLEQESNGFSALPQGNVQIRQFSTIELSTSELSN